MVLTILQWNARRLIVNRQEFKKFILNQERCPDIICIQESWLKPCLNYTLHLNLAVHRDHGGVSIFIKQGIGYRIIEINKELEVVIVEIWEGSQSIKIVNLYNQCGKLNK